MSTPTENDFLQMEEKLRHYIEKGITHDSNPSSEEYSIRVAPEASNIKRLNQRDGFSGRFIAVDCSTRTLRRANNWGIYLMRVAYASVKGNEVDWNYEERVFTTIGDMKTRNNALKDYRIELESELALRLLASHEIENSNRKDFDLYLLLDGGAYFGGKRKFRLSLYEKCKKMKIVLLAFSKNSPLLHDDKGRDLIANVSQLSSYEIWAYHPVKVADRRKNLFGDISLVKLHKESPRVFRCDVMEYLNDLDVNEILSPLCSLAGDPRCLGYPVPLFLAHDFSGPSDTALLHYYDKIEDKLSQAGITKMMHLEEQTCSFSDELHGVQFAFRKEGIGNYA